jgi:hypothetical protein
LQATQPAFAGFWEDRRSARVRLLGRSSSDVPQPTLIPRSLSEGRQAWLDGRYPLEKYLSDLLEEVKDPALEAPLAGLLDLARRKRALNPARVESERAALLSLSAQRSDRAALEALVAEALAVRLGARSVSSFYAALLREAERIGVPPDEELLAYASLLREEESLPVERIAASLKACETRAGLRP